MQKDEVQVDATVSTLLETVGQLSDELRRRRAQSRLADGRRQDRRALRELEQKIADHWTQIRAIRGGAEPDETVGSRRSKWE